MPRLFQIPSPRKQVDQGATVQQTFPVPPVGQSEPSRIRAIEAARFQQPAVTGPVDQLSGASIQATFPVPPVSQPQRYNTDQALFVALYQQPNAMGPVEQLGGATVQATFPVPPLFRTPYLVRRQILSANKFVDGASVQATFIFPVSQPVFNYYLEPLNGNRRDTGPRPQFDGTIAVIAQTYVFPVSQPTFTQFRTQVAAPVRLEGATTDLGVNLYRLPRTNYRIAYSILEAAQCLDGPSIQPTDSFPVNQPLFNYYFQHGNERTVGPRPQIDGVTTTPQTYIFPVSQPTLPPVRTQVAAPIRLDGATTDARSYLFPVNQPLVYLQSRQPLGAPVYFEGATNQQTYIFPVSQPDPTRIRLPESPRYLVEAPKRLDGSTVQQTYVFPTNEPELRRYSELRRLDAIVDAPRYWYGFAAIQPQTYIFPVSQPLVYLGSRQPITAPVYFEGATRQQTYIFPVAQPQQLGRFDITRIVGSRIQLDGTAPQQTYIFPPNQPGYPLPQPPLIQAPRFTDGATRQQTFIFSVSQPQLLVPGRAQTAPVLIHAAVIQSDVFLPPIDLSGYQALQRLRFLVDASKQFHGATIQQTYLFPPNQPLNYLPWRLPIDAPRYYDGIIVPPVPTLIRPTGSARSAAPVGTVQSAGPVGVVLYGGPEVIVS